jgi:hypothetical protein
VDGRVDGDGEREECVGGEGGVFEGYVSVPVPSVLGKSVAKIMRIALFR